MNSLVWAACTLLSLAGLYTLVWGMFLRWLERDKNDRYAALEKRLAELEEDFGAMGAFGRR